MPIYSTRHLAQQNRKLFLSSFPNPTKNSVFTLLRVPTTSTPARYIPTCHTRSYSSSNLKMTEAKEFPPKAVRDIAAEVGSLLKERKETVSVAETAAGGLISASLLSLPGASGFYRGGLTLYTLESRIAFAGWTEESIKGYRGPTTDIVAGLASNVRAKLGSTYTVSESGTAGPTGGNTPNRTPGYIALAVATESGSVYKKELSTGLGGDREGNMIAFAVEALILLRDVIKGDAKL